MNRKMYRKVAKKHKVSVKEVKDEMQLAINSAYVHPNDAAKNIPRKGEVPTVDEFLAYAVEKVKKTK